MSSRRLELSRLARQDFVDILRYSESRWSAEQAGVYAERLYEGLETIGAFPRMGREREGFHPSTRVFAIEEHLVIYTVAEDIVQVLRIVHKRADWTLDD